MTKTTTTNAQNTGARKAAATSKPKAPASKPNPAPASTSRRTRAAAHTHDTGTESSALVEPAEETGQPEKKKKARRTKEQMAEARAAVQKAAEVKSAKEARALQAIAEMEDDIAQQDAQLVTPKNPAHSARTVPKASACDFDDTASDLTETIPSDNEPQSDYRYPSEPVQTNEHQDTVPPAKTKANTAAKNAESEFEEFDLELTPVAKRASAASKGKGVRASIINLRLTGNADFNQKSVKQTQESSKLVVFSSFPSFTCSPSMKQHFSTSPLPAQPAVLRSRLVQSTDGLPLPLLLDPRAHAQAARPPPPSPHQHPQSQLLHQGNLLCRQHCQTASAFPPVVPSRLKTHQM